MKNYLLVALFILVFACKGEEDPAPIKKKEPVDDHISFVTVPDDYSTIQLAIDQSKNGDTVVVKPGTYKENIDFKGKNILLTSLFYLDMNIDYISSTIINGSEESVVKFMNHEGKKTIIQGFTIREGTGTIYTRSNGNITRGGGGILALEASPTIRYNIIEENEATDVSGANPYAGGGGLRLELGTPTVHNNIIRNNKGGFGAGVFLDSTAAVFTNNIVVGNEATKIDFGGGGGLYLDFKKKGSAGNVIVNNTIVNNLSEGEGGGVVIASEYAYENLVFRNNIIYNNENEEVFTRLGAVANSFKPEYCLIEGGYASGINVLNTDPKLLEITFALDEDSPCIDTGDPSAQFNDPNDGENALPPGLGLPRNDIGAYGGPDAFHIIPFQ